MDRILTWVLFFAVIAISLAPTPPKDPHHMWLWIDGFLLIVAAVRVVLDFKRPR